MDGAVDWRAATFGILLGCGALLIWRGFRAMTGKAGTGKDRRQAMWTLGGGIALVAVSMLGIALIVPA